MTFGQAIRHLLAPNESRCDAVAKRVADAEQDLKSAAANNVKVTKLLEKTLDQNAKH